MLDKSRAYVEKTPELAFYKDGKVLYALSAASSSEDLKMKLREDE